MNETHALVSSRARGLKRPPTKGTRHGNGVGQGDGWGGPARGSGRGSAALLIPGCDGSKRPIGRSRRELREERAEALEDLLFHLAMHAEREETQIVAAVKLHEIICGPPVARQVVEDMDDYSHLTDAELVAEHARVIAQLQSIQAPGVVRAVFPDGPKK